ncbi:hypothetical protein ACE1CI_26590 [Aerosakkonemataceae cyanobacterium BLCC-F50]|uniref:Uncharacterized protein n=1 Tax=Floridaenema flaviceps BLCC-F50 TaxID=3153642 RepID=A0ABV4XXV8_9CYAN
MPNYSLLESNLPNNKQPKLRAILNLGTLRDRTPPKMQKRYAILARYANVLLFFSGAIA